MNVFHRAVVLAASAGFVTIASGSANADPRRARTLFVSMIGIESPGCGQRNDPCRTIGLANNNARDKDAVAVEPGLYGDLNGDGDQDDAGEEYTTRAEGCTVCLNKRVFVYSTQGAAVTVINDIGRTTAVISADGSVFGYRDRGFTLTGSNGAALRVELAGNVRVPGNLGGGVRLYRNIIVNNGSPGIQFPRFAGAPNHQVHFNEIYGNNPEANCGLLNASGGSVNATQNFWGARTGPASIPRIKRDKGLAMSPETQQSSPSPA
jgi:hypothetical protein